MNKQIIRYLYYFFNFLVAFLIVLIMGWGSRLMFWQKNITGQADVLGLLKEKRQELTPDFILSQIKKKEEVVSLVAVGDVMLSRVVGQKMRVNGYNYPFEKLIDFTKNADLSFANLETAVFPGRVINTGEMMFRSDPESLISLSQAGFDLVSLANNHTPNFGPEGLKKTFEYLKASGIEYVGAGEDFIKAHQPLIKEVNGLKIAFLAYNDRDVVPDSYSAGNNWAGTALMDINELKKDIQTMRNQVDIIIISMHSGTEYVARANDQQIEFAHTAIDNGADLVIGHHPHVVQEIEKYRGKYIFYSLGNFIFDQMWSKETREGLVLKILLNKDGVKDFFLTPIVIDDYAQPRSADSAESEKILSRLNFNLQSRESLIYQEGRYKIEKRQGVFNDDSDGDDPSVNSEYNRDVNNEDKDEDEGDHSMNSGSGEGVIVYHDQTNERVYVRKNQDIIWISDPLWRVKKIAIGDVNFDGRKDLTMIVWKKGNYGPQKPFWVQKNNMSEGNHLFVYSFFNDGFRPLWQSSKINQPNIDLLINDLDRDGKNELIVLENKDEPSASYSARVQAEGSWSSEDEENEDEKAEYLAVWRWDDWGFKNIWRSEKGEYKSLKILLGEVVVE